MRRASSPSASEPLSPALVVTGLPVDAVGAVAGSSGGRAGLVRGSAYSVVALGIAALTGAVFWLVAARNYPSDAVGTASALFTSVLFVNFLSNLGIPIAMARFADRAPADYDVLFTRAALATVLASVAASACYFVVVDPAALRVFDDWGRLTGLAVFSLVVAGTSLAILVDVRLMVGRHWRWMVLRVGAVGLLRLPLLWLHTDVGDALWLFLLAAVAPAASGVIGIAALRVLGGVRYRLRPRPAGAHAALRYAGVNYLATLAVDGPRFALPVLVLLSVSARANASFYVAWSVTAIAFLVPATIGQVLLVEATRVNDHWDHIRTAIVIAGGVMAAGSLLSWARADVLTSLYGDSYGEAARILPRLMAAGVPWAITSVALADARVRRDNAATLLITIVLAGAILVPASILVSSGGVAGAADAWLFGHVAGAVIGVLVLVGASRRHAAAAVS